jgi:hypothetical protein
MWKTLTRHARMRIARYTGTRAALHFPTVPFSLEDIFHLHPVVGRPLFSSKRYDRIRFIFAEGYGANAHVHGAQIRTFGQVVENTLPHRLSILDVLAAAEK